MGFNCLKATEPLQVDSELCTTKSARYQVLVLNWWTSERWNDEFSLQQPSRFEPGTPRLGIQIPNH